MSHLAGTCNPSLAHLSYVRGVPQTSTQTTQCTSSAKHLLAAPGWPACARQSKCTFMLERCSKTLNKTTMPQKFPGLFLPEVAITKGTPNAPNHPSRRFSPLFPAKRRRCPVSTRFGRPDEGPLVCQMRQVASREPVGRSAHGVDVLDVKEYVRRCPKGMFVGQKWCGTSGSVERY